ncbi:nuclear transport factor 2 family protein [Pseudonocardia pini]|uniref:nuclear transport factor 2 family protein n=1 Tax=Pseudonocardia pini TaxID=2758030 RepID=UPI0015F02C70|nr:nuclear transport factor 2 family protein [Pseudonocardia pini]
MTYDLERLDAEDAITRLLFAYCEGIDEGALDDVARLFEHGTWYLTADTPLAGFDAVSGFLADNVILYDGVPATRHTVSNIRIDLADDRRSARSRSYVVVFQSVPGAAPHIMFQGAYDDTFTVDEHGWHFAERRIRADGTGDMSLHLKGAEARSVGVG